MPGTIVTKYIGPTNHKPGRIKALSTSGVTLTVSWDHIRNADENHREAARDLARKVSEGNEYFNFTIEDEACLLPDAVGWAYAFIMKGEPK